LESAPGHVFRGIRFREGVWNVEAEFPHGEGRGIRRTELHRVMTEAALGAGVDLRWGARISGISDAGVYVDGELVRARWIVGADGGNSAVRGWARLDADYGSSRRYGFRRHYRVENPGDFMEIHWGDGCQLYITPVAPHEICVVLISRDFHLRLAEALPAFPEVNARLAASEPLNLERGGVTVSRRLRAVSRGNVALVGDASGSVDAITGDGLCLLLQQSAELAECFAAGSLAHYQSAHRRIGRRPGIMSRLMLMLDGQRGLRHSAMRLFEFEPALFARLLAVHVGDYGL
jgi:flavin-dependent dehydrogenase